MSKNDISRRKFLRDSTCAAMGTTAFLSTALNLGMINALSARPHIISNTNDYKAIVCILLSGGADTFNVLVPTEDSEYDTYWNTRGADLRLDRTNINELLPLDFNHNGRTFSVHGQMPEVRDMFDQGYLSFVSNIGTLAEPIANKTEYYAGIKKRPLGLYSHSDQQMQWQTSVTGDRAALGLGGRMADILHDLNTIPEVSMNISLAGKNRFQAGTNMSEYSISRDATIDNIGYDGVPSWWSDGGVINDLRTSTINNLAEQEYSNIFHKTIGDLTKQTSQGIEYYKAALGNLVPLNTTFSNTNFSKELKKVAELIRVQQHLGLNRQIFFVNLGGWDHHANLKAEQIADLPVLSQGLSEFRTALEEINRTNDVVSFTISDFARTLTSNGSGTDHAWGGNQMIMGGPVTGKQIFGDYPSLDLDGDLNVSQRGNIIPTTSVDEFYAEIAMWFGVSPNDLDYVLPNLCRFYSSSSCTQPPSSNYMPIGMFS